MKQSIYKFLTRYFSSIMLKVVIVLFFFASFKMDYSHSIPVRIVSFVFILIAFVLMDIWKWFCNKIEGKK